MRFFSVIIVITPFDFGNHFILRFSSLLCVFVVEGEGGGLIRAMSQRVFFSVTPGYLSISVYTQTELYHVIRFEYSETVDFSSSYLISIVINNRSSQQNQNKEIINQLALKPKNIPMLTKWLNCEWGPTITLSNQLLFCENRWHNSQSLIVNDAWKLKEKTDWFPVICLI